MRLPISMVPHSEEPQWGSSGPPTQDGEHWVSILPAPTLHIHLIPASFQAVPLPSHCPSSLMKGPRPAGATDKFSDPLTTSLREKEQKDIWVSEFPAFCECCQEPLAPPYLAPASLDGLTALTESYIQKTERRQRQPVPSLLGRGQTVEQGSVVPCVWQAAGGRGDTQGVAKGPCTEAADP